MVDTHRPETNLRRIQAKIKAVVDHTAFSTVIIILILLNAMIVGLETYPTLYEAYGHWFHFADRILLWLFTIEILLKLYSSRPFLAYFKDSWNIFDFLIVLSGHLFVGAHFVTVLRILRILRLLRAISIIPSLRKIVNALLLTIPALGNIMILLSLLFYIFAVLGTMLFGQYEPAHFGSLHATLLTLFQVVTLESWASGVMRPLLESVPWAWTYFVAFILVGTFVIFNLFVGVIVSNVEKVNELEEEKEKAVARAVEANGGQFAEVIQTGNGAQQDEAEQQGVKNHTLEHDQASSQRELQALKQEIRELKSMIAELHGSKEYK